jgi:hypothetical protein
MAASSVTAASLSRASSSASTNIFCPPSDPFFSGDAAPISFSSAAMVFSGSVAFDASCLRPSAVANALGDGIAFCTLPEATSRSARIAASERAAFAVGDVAASDANAETVKVVPAARTAATIRQLKMRAMNSPLKFIGE